MSERNSNKDWNYHPALPLQDNSVFSNWKNPQVIVQWFIRNWLTLSEFVLLAILATAFWLLAYPAVEKTLKFDHRDQTRNNRSFLFSDQVKDNMFWSLTSGVAHLSFFQSITWWLMANGHIPRIEIASNPIWFLLGFVLIPVWSAFHFYWIHRLLHVPFFYKHVHSLHHKNINIGPWSGIAMHPIEHSLYISSLCIHWIVASHPLHVIFHVVWLGPGAAMSHTGYENLLIKNKERLALGTFYHQLHHRYFECNYGNQEMPWDRWFGTFHDGSDECSKQTRERKKRLFKGQQAR